MLPCIQSIQASRIVIPDDCELCALCLDLGKETPAALEYDELMYCAEHYPHTRKLEMFVSRVQQSIPAFEDAKVEYWRKEDWPRMKERITHENMVKMASELVRKRRLCGTSLTKGKRQGLCQNRNPLFILISGHRFRSALLFRPYQVG